MSFTLNNLNGGSASVVFVAAVEGYQYLLTSGNRDHALTAWQADGAPFIGALDGLFVDLQNSSSINPWEAFSEGGECTLTIAPDSVLGDFFGVSTGRADGGTRATLAASIDRLATVVTVDSAAAFPASGLIHIGTECIEYSAKTATTFTGCLRGKYSPFSAANLGTYQLAQPHSVEGVEFGRKNLPVVSTLPRVWQGRRVGVWMHVVENGGINVKSQALLVFAGKIDSVRDDASTMCTVLGITHVLDGLRDHVIMGEQFNARIVDGFYLEPGTRFDASDGVVSSGQFNANPLICKSGANPSIPDEVEQGWYTLTELVDRINRWLDAANLGFDHQLQPVIGSRAGYSVSFVGATAIQRCYSTLTLPRGVATFLGWYDPANYDRPMSLEAAGNGTQVYSAQSAFEPMRLYIPTYGSGPGFRIESSTGRFNDQTKFLPADSGISAADLIANPTGWGMFSQGSQIYIGLYTGTSIVAVILSVLSDPVRNKPQARSVPISGAQLELKQVIVLESNFRTLLSTLVTGSGNSLYNGIFDTGFAGACVPTEIVNLQSFYGDGDETQTRCVIDRPTRLGELLNGDMILRRKNVVWKKSRIDFVSWSSPNIRQSIATIDDTNKAEPVGGRHQRSSIEISNQWLYNIFKIEYGREINKDTYLDSVVIEDRVSVDDHGGAGQPLTIQARNTYASSALGRAEIDELIASFLAFVPFFSRPIRLLTRSIGLPLYESLSAGDVCAVSDLFARDPATGLRGASLLPGLIVAHRYSPGGIGPNGSNAPMVGEVTVAIVDTGLVKPYSPSAKVSIYSAGGPSLTCLPNSYVNAPAVDAASFSAGDKIRILEIDSDTFPVSYDHTILSVVGSVITLTAAISGYDSSKSYRVISQPATSALPSQLTDAFYDLNQAYYLVSNNNTIDTVQSHAVAGEIVNLAVADMPMDVAVDYAMAKNANWLIDHGTAYQSPAINRVFSPNPGAAGFSWLTVSCSRIFLGSGKYQGAARKAVSVAPVFRNKGSGAAQCRVSIMKELPTGSFIDCVRPAAVASAVFSTTSTANVTAAAIEIDCTNLQDAEGYAWLLLEISPNCFTHGIAQLREMERR